MYDAMYQQFKTYITFSWFDSGEQKIAVIDFNYTLTQYAPSVYAKIECLIPDSLIKQFDDIKTRKILERNCRIDVIGSGGGGLTRTADQYSMFSGPWKLMILKYTTVPTSINPFSGSTGKDGSNPNSDKGYGLHHVVTLECVDRTWYSMSVGERNKIYEQKTISDVVKEIAQRHDGTPKIVDTEEKFDWKQYDKTDYFMIRYLLPFAQSKEKDVAYNFYCYNNDVIFQPVTKSEELTIKISAKNVTEFDPSKNSQSNDELIDKLAGSKDLNVKDSGLKGFRLTTPVKSNKTADSGKTYDGDNIRSLKISMEDPKFKEIYISSFRKRILSLKKVISINTFLDTNITPMNLVEIVDQTEGQQGMLAGKFYVVSVTHHIPKGIDDPYIPYTQLVLSTDVEDKGNDSEGSPISSGGSATSAKAGNTSGSGGQAGSNLLSQAKELIENVIQKKISPQTIATEVLSKAAGLGQNININKANPITNLQEEITERASELWHQTIGNKEIFKLTDGTSLVSYTETNSETGVSTPVTEIRDSTTNVLKETMKITTENNKKVLKFTDSSGNSISSPSFFNEYTTPTEEDLNPNTSTDDPTDPTDPTEPTTPTEPTEPTDPEKVIATIGDINDAIDETKLEIYTTMKSENQINSFLWTMIFYDPRG